MFGRVLIAIGAVLMLAASIEDVMQGEYGWGFVGILVACMCLYTAAVEWLVKRISLGTENGTAIEVD